MSQITLTAAGPVGCGKSALLGEIEILLRTLQIPHSYQDAVWAQKEKSATGADWIGELERAKPTVLLVDQGPSNATLVAASARRLAFEEAARICDAAVKSSEALQARFASGELPPNVMMMAIAIATAQSIAAVGQLVREKAKV